MNVKLFFISPPPVYQFLCASASILSHDGNTGGGTRGLLLPHSYDIQTSEHAIPLKSERVPSLEHDHFLAGVRKAGDLPGLDRINKLFCYAVTRLVNILANKANDGEKFMFPVILPHELQDIEPVFRQVRDPFPPGKDARDLFRPVLKSYKEPVVVNIYFQPFLFYHRHGFLPRTLTEQGHTAPGVKTGHRSSPYSLAMTDLSLSLAWPAISASFGLLTACMEATGSTAATSTPTPAISCTMTLQGSMMPILSSASRALYAYCGLQAPRMRYFLKSTFSFFFRVSFTSISVSTPKPSFFSSSVARLTASSKVVCSVLLK